MLRVFISWSGEPSRTIARNLASWMRAVVQHVRPWVSDEDIKSGERWNDALSQELEKSDYGILCVTRANQAAPWLMFEAGALAKRLDVARVVPLCIDLEPSDITSPLQAFQARRLEKESMRRLVYELWEIGDPSRRREDVETLFDPMWPGFEAKIQDALLSSSPTTRDLRTVRETAIVLSDALQSARALNPAQESAAVARRIDPPTPSNDEADFPRRSSSSVRQFAVDDRVRHPVAGAGTVVEVSARGRREAVLIQYDGGRKGWISGNLTQLRRLPAES
jgi:hypothetical protein